MNKRELKKALKENLTPLYNGAEKARVDYTIRKANAIWEAKEALKLITTLPANKFGVSDADKPRHDELYKLLYGEQVTSYCEFSKRDFTRLQGGLIKALSDKEYKLLMDKRFNRKQITAYFKAEFKENLAQLIETVYARINGYKPKAINLMPFSEHDLNFILEFKGGKQQSYTINTIQAGGYNIQCLHLRTNHKLHTKVVA